MRESYHSAAIVPLVLEELGHGEDVFRAVRKVFDTYVRNSSAPAETVRRVCHVGGGRGRGCGTHLLGGCEEPRVVRGEVAMALRLNDHPSPFSAENGRPCRPQWQEHPAGGLPDGGCVKWPGLSVGSIPHQHHHLNPSSCTTPTTGPYMRWDGFQCICHDFNICPRTDGRGGRELSLRASEDFLLKRHVCVVRACVCVRVVMRCFLSQEGGRAEM
jgi:hypothetical protein